MKFRVPGLVLGACALVTGCVTPPMGPTIPVMPGDRKPFAAFQRDDAECQDYASSRTQGGADRANNKALTEGLLGTALGAGLGAAVGGGHGAAVGAASGAVVGTAVGANTSAHAQYSLQDRYNIAYAQCMSSKGNKVEWGPPGGYYGPRAYGPPPPPPPPPYPPPPPPQGY